MYKLKLTLLQQEVLEFLFTNPEKSFTSRAISISLKVSQPGISKALKTLKHSALIEMKKDIASKRLSIALNRDNPIIMGLKRSYNLRCIYESGLADFLKNTFPGSTIILFGSYSRGDDTSSSDIDIAVIRKKTKDIDLKIFENFLQREISLNFYESMANVYKEMRQNLCNGIVLSGGVEL